MTTEHTIYLNGYYFDSLWSADEYNDRPESNRMHEKALWTVYQLLKPGTHELVITDKDKQVVLKTKGTEEFRAWVKQRYPTYIYQLDMRIYTSHPHPGSLLKP